MINHLLSGNIENSKSATALIEICGSACQRTIKTGSMTDRVGV